MSIIQNIRERAAWLVFGVIALSLIGFLLMDAFVGGRGRGMFSGNSTNVGTINGEKVDYIEFEKKKKMMEDQYRASGYPVNEMMQQNIQEQVWNQYIEDNVLQKEFKKLGLDVSPKELGDILFGKNPPEDLKRQFINQQTGEYDANAARLAISNLRKQKNSEITQKFEDVYLPALINNRLKERYSALLANTSYIPKWMLEKLNADNSTIASIAFVNIPYSTIPDSSVKISDDEISNYVSKHPDDYKQATSRSISYVVFNAAPSQADSQALFNQLENLKSEFKTTPDVAAFLVRNGSEIPNFDGYVSKSAMKVPHTDSIQALADGDVFGPYLDAQNYAVAKMIGRQTLPDSVKARHILIQTVDRNGQRLVADSTAEKRIDSVITAINNGADFENLMLTVSDDKASVSQDKGVMKFSAAQIQNKEGFDQEFGKFILFEGKKGEHKKVKTQFGYHYIEILDQTNFEPSYKVAYLSKNISASQETQNTASGLANQFAGESRTAKAFEDNATAKKYNKLIASEIKPIDNMIPGLGSSRQLVRWIYEADRGDVSEPYDLGDKFVVAMVTEINKEGTMSAAKARTQVEFIVRNKKKAEQIIQKIGTVKSLETTASALKTQTQNADSISFASPVIPNVGQEAKVIGATFNKEWKGKITPPIAGNGGVFVIKPGNISAKQNVNGSIEQQRTSMLMQTKSMSGYRSLEALKKAADVKDNRSKFL
ncbi:MAG: peptidylprolyl isomerase [Chitinophagaceae bacterium]